MSRPADRELALLGQVGYELREVFAARGHRVEAALDTDSSFGSGHSRSALMRDLAIEAVSSAASRLGVDFRPVNGDGREFQFFHDGVDRRYRFRRARRRADGDFVVPVSSESALSSDTDGIASLFVEEQWVLLWTTTADGLIADIVVAEVRGYLAGKPGRLDLGPAIYIGGDTAPRGVGFIPTDEDLEIYKDEDEDEDTDDGEASSAS